MARTLVIIGSGVHTSSPGLAASDRAALGLALQRLAGPVAVRCPAADERAMVFALAAGAPDVRTLAGIEAEPFDVALVGYGALDQAGEQLAGLLAERNQATLVFDVLHVERSPAGPSAAGWVVTKDLGRGRREEHVLDGPAVLVISPQAPRPPYVSRYRLQTAIDTLRRTSSGVDTPAAAGANDWRPARPRAKLGRGGQKLVGAANSRLDEAFGLDAPASSGDREQILEADPATCAQHLLRYLAHHGFVERPVSGDMGDRVTCLARGRASTSDRQSRRQGPHVSRRRSRRR